MLLLSNISIGSSDSLHLLGIVFLVIVTACTVLHGRCDIASGAKTITFNTALSLGIAYETSRALNTSLSLGIAF